MALTLIHREAELTGVPRYEVLWGELADFIDLKVGAIDDKALRIFLAAVWIHLFSSDQPVMLWMQGCPPWLAGALKMPLARQLHDPDPHHLGEAAAASSECSLWMVSGAEGIFDRYQRQKLYLMAQAHRGRMTWPAPWKGRVTIVVHLPLALNAARAKVARAAWQYTENDFISVRWANLEGDHARLLKQVAERGRIEIGAGQLMVNLLDQNSRDLAFRSVEPPGLFESIPFLVKLTGVVRGEAWDAAAHGAQAIRLAMAHASLMAKPEADAEDLTLARKVMFDAVPQPTLEVLKAIPLDGYWSRSQLFKLTEKVDQKHIRKTVDRLVATGAILQDRSYRPHRVIGDWYSVTAEFQRALMAL